MQEQERERDKKEGKVAAMVGSKFRLSRRFFQQYCLANTHGAHLRHSPSALPPPLLPINVRQTQQQQCIRSLEYFDKRHKNIV